MRLLTHEITHNIWLKLHILAGNDGRPGQVSEEESSCEVHVPA